MDLTSEHKILDLKNKLEASVIIWRRKMTSKDGKSAWGSAVSVEKREIFEDRAETILLILKQRFPGIPQSSLDISKIQYNEVRSNLYLFTIKDLDIIHKRCSSALDMHKYALNLYRVEQVDTHVLPVTLHGNSCPTLHLTCIIPCRTCASTFLNFI